MLSLLTLLFACGPSELGDVDGAALALEALSVQFRRARICRRRPPTSARPAWAKIPPPAWSSAGVRPS